MPTAHRSKVHLDWIWVCVYIYFPWLYIIQTLTLHLPSFHSFSHENAKCTLGKKSISPLKSNYCSDLDKLVCRKKNTFLLLSLFNYADLKCMDMKINGKQPFKSCRLTYRRWTNGIWHRVRYKYCYYGGKREKRANTDVLHSNAVSRVYWIYITLFITIIIPHYSRVCASCS